MIVAVPTMAVESEVPSASHEEVVYQCKESHRKNRFAGAAGDSGRLACSSRSDGTGRVHIRNKTIFEHKRCVRENHIQKKIIDSTYIPSQVPLVWRPYFYDSFPVVLGSLTNVGSDGIAHPCISATRTVGERAVSRNVFDGGPPSPYMERDSERTGQFTEKLHVPEALTFDDVLLRPKESRVEPDEADVSTRVSRSVEVNVPILSAAMDTVTESQMAIAMARQGGLGVLHRNLDVDEAVAEVERVKRADELVIRDVVTANPEQTVRDVDAMMDREGVSGAPVTDDDDT